MAGFSCSLHAYMLLSQNVAPASFLYTQTPLPFYLLRGVWSIHKTGLLPPLRQRAQRHLHTQNPRALFLISQGVCLQARVSKGLI